MVISFLSALLILVGLVFFLGAGVGILRFPDFFSRMHAAGKGDTLSTLLIIAGFALYQTRGLGDSEFSVSTVLVVMKMLVIIAFLYIASATSTSALAEAGWEDGNDPVIALEHENRLAGPPESSSAAAEFNRSSTYDSQP